MALLSGALMGPAQYLRRPGMTAPTAPASGGLLAQFNPNIANNRVYQAFDRNREPLVNMLLGGVGAETPLERMRGMAGGVMQGRENSRLLEMERRKQEQTQQQVNSTLQAMQKAGRDDLVQAVQGGLPISEAWKTFLAKDTVKPTDDMREYDFARQQGYQGSFQDFMMDMRKAGATNVTVGGGKYGTIPPGYELVEGPQGAQMRPIPGGPVAQEMQAAQDKSGARMGNAMTASDTVTTAAKRAREAVANQNFGPAGTSAVAGIPVIGAMTDSAEVMRQTDVLKSLAAAENLNAMRQSSPTGGALGNVTEKELKLLQDKSGALDPNSPTFLRDLEDYERTLLRTIHGREVGDAIFEQTRQQDGWTDRGNGVRIRKLD